MINIRCTRLIRQPALLLQYPSDIEGLSQTVPTGIRSLTFLVKEAEEDYKALDGVLKSCSQLVKLDVSGDSFLSHPLIYRRLWKGSLSVVQLCYWVIA